MKLKQHILLTCSSALLLLNAQLGPALAQVETHLSGYAQDTALLGVMTLDAQRWQSIFAQSASDHLDMYQLAELALDLQALGLEHLDQEADNLGKYLSMGLSQTDQIHFALDLRSGARLDRFLQQALAQQDAASWQRETFAGYPLYQLDLSPLALEFESLYLLITDQQVLGSFESAESLKSRLYRHKVLGSDSAYKLISQPAFQATQKALASEDAWVFFNTALGIPVLDRLLGTELWDEQQAPWFQDLLSYYQGLGFSASLDPHTLRFKSYVHHASSALSPFQQKAIAIRQPGQRPDLKALLNKMPAQSFVLSSTQYLDWNLQYPLPTDQPISLPEGFSLEDEGLWQDQAAVISAWTGLDLQRDLLPFIDGRMVWGLAPPEQGKQGVSALAVLGLQTAQAAAFESRLADKLLLQFPTERQAQPGQQSALRSEDYLGVPIYTLPVDRLKDDWADMPNWFQPAFARQDDLLLLAESPETLKQALKRQQSQHPLLYQWQTQTQTQQANDSFVLDIAGLSQWMAQHLSEELGDLNVLLELLQTWHSFYSASTQAPQSHQSITVLHGDFKRSHPALIGLFSDAQAGLEGAQNHARIAAVKSNMFTLQTLAETYAVEFDGIYAPSLQSLQNAAQDSELYGNYWKELINPYTGQTGIGKALLDYQDYVPGPEMAGLVLYEVWSENNSSYYRVYATDQEGQLIQNQDTVYSLSNSF